MPRKSDIWINTYANFDSEKARAFYFEGLEAAEEILENFDGDNPHFDEVIVSAADIMFSAQCVAYTFAREEGRRIAKFAIGPSSDVILGVQCRDDDERGRPDEVSDMNWAVFCFLLVRYPEHRALWEDLLAEPGE